MAMMGGVLLLAGCRGDRRGSGESSPPLSRTQTSDPPAPSADERIVARVGSRTVSMRQLQQPLLEAEGLNVLLNLVQLELAKETAERSNVVVLPEDIRQERAQTMARMFESATPEDYDELLEQFLRREGLSRPSFDLVMETNAYLRKIAEPMLKDKITEESLEEGFRAMYGETVKVRHIQAANVREIQEAQRRLAAGETFEKIAQELSRNARTKDLGGELPAFSRMATDIPQSFKDAAFALEVGEVSDPVQASGAYHLIKLEQRIAPKAVKFEEHKESIRRELYERLMQATVKDLRQQLAAKALAGLKIEEPTLKAQFDQRMNQRTAKIKDREQIREELEKQREQLTTQQAFPEPATAATEPTEPTTAEAASPDLPPATEAGQAPDQPATQPTTR